MELVAKCATHEACLEGELTVHQDEDTLNWTTDTSEMYCPVVAIDDADEECQDNWVVLARIDGVGLL